MCATDRVASGSLHLSKMFRQARTAEQVCTFRGAERDIFHNKSFNFILT